MLGSEFISVPRGGHKVENRDRIGSHGLNSGELSQTLASLLRFLSFSIDSLSFLASNGLFFTASRFRTVLVQTSGTRPSI